MSYLRSYLLEARHVSWQVLRLSAGGGEAVPVAEPSPGMRIMYKLDGKVPDDVLNSCIKWLGGKVWAGL